MTPSDTGTRARVCFALAAVLSLVALLAACSSSTSKGAAATTATTAAATATTTGAATTATTAAATATTTTAATATTAAASSTACIFGSWTVTTPATLAGSSWTIHTDDSIDVTYAGELTGPATFKSTLPANPVGSSGSYVATPITQHVTSHGLTVTLSPHNTTWTCQGNSLTLVVASSGTFQLSRNGG